MGTDSRNNSYTIEEEVVEKPKRNALLDRVTQCGDAAVNDERVLSEGRAADIKRLMRDRFPYNDWLVQKFNSISEISLAEENYEKFLDFVENRSALEKLREDARTLQKTVDDITEDLRGVIDQGVVLTNGEIDRMLDRLWVCDQAKSVLIQANASFDIARETGAFSLIGLFIEFGYRGKIPKAQLLLDQLENLLKKAEEETSNAKLKLVINTSISVIGIFAPQLSLAARGGLFIGQAVINHMLSDPSTTSQVVNVTGHVAGSYASLESISKQKKKIATGVSKSTAVVGFTFDIHDINVAKEDEEEIRKLMDQADQYIKEEILPELLVLKTQLDILKLEVLPRLLTELKENGIDVAAARDMLKSRMEVTGYAP